jgi:ribosome-binding protein aMBF1 (putative translation factor)
MIRLKVTNSKDKCLTGRELRRGRNEAGLSQQQLAEALGVDRITIRRWEDLHGIEFCLHPAQMQSLLKALGAASL